MAKIKGLTQRGEIWHLNYAGPSGKMIRESSHTTRQREAAALLVKRRNQVLEGKNPILNKSLKRHTFGELIQEYRPWASKQKAFRSKDGFIRQLENYFGNTLLAEFSMMVVEQYQSERLLINKPATVNRHLATLKHMFTKAEDWEMVDEAVSRKVHKVKLSPENNQRIRFLLIE